MAALPRAWSALRVPSNHLGRLTGKFGFEAPTGVQRATLDALMPRSPSLEATRGPPARHAVIRWPTGSGKTLAFAVPSLARMDMRACGGGIQTLVVSPTRELALQTLRVFKRLSAFGKSNKKGHTVKVMAILGRSTPRLENELRKRPPDIAVGTPIALRKLLHAGKLPLTPRARDRTLILDEIGALTSPHNWSELRHVLYDYDAATYAAAKASKGGGGQPPAPRWVHGSMWFVSAHVPPGSVENCLVAAHGLDSSYDSEADEQGGNESESNQRASTAARAPPRLPKTCPPVVVLAPESGGAMPAEVRHVALPLFESKRQPSVGAVVAGMLAHGRGAKRYVVGGDEATDIDESSDDMTSDDHEAFSDGDEHPESHALGGEVGDSDVADGAAAFGTGLDESARGVLVFTSTSRDCEELRRVFKNRRISASAVHSRDGDSARDPRLTGHARRGAALLDFAAGKVRVLLATDMLAHGVDIRGASHVLNQHVPADAETYLHRAGRVGRKGGGPGTVVSLPRTEAELERLRGISAELGFELEIEQPPRSTPRPQDVQRARREARIAAVSGLGYSHEKSNHLA